MKKESQLHRGYGFWTSWFVVLASMIGSGILTNTGPIVKAVGSYSANLGLWALGGLLALCGALTLAEMATARPHVGGDYVYVKEAFGDITGFTYGWAMVLLGFAAPVALVSSMASHYFLTFLGWDTSRVFLSKFLASSLILLFTYAHTRSHKESAWLQNLTTLFNVSVLLFFSFLVLRSGSHSVWQPSTMPVLKVSGWGTGLILVMYAYTGWNASSYLAGEIKNPSRNLPLCLGLGCLSVFLIYFVMNLAYAASLEPSQIMLMKDSELAQFAEVAFRQVLSPSLVKLFSVLVSFGIVAALSAYILTGPRILYAMSHDRLFPSWALKVHPKFHQPVTALWVQTFFSLVFLWSGTFEQILNFASFGLSVISTLVVGSIFGLRRSKGYHPTFKVPLYPWLPLGFLAVNTASWLSSLIDQPVISLMSFGFILLGIPFYFLYKKGLVKS